MGISGADPSNATFFSLERPYEPFPKPPRFLNNSWITNIAMENSPFSIGNSSSIGWSIFQPVMLGKIPECVSPYFPWKGATISGPDILRFPQWKFSERYPSWLDHEWLSSHAGGQEVLAARKSFRNGSKRNQAVMEMKDFFFRKKYVDVSENSGSGTPKSSILIGFSIIHHPF